MFHFMQDSCQEERCGNNDNCIPDFETETILIAVIVIRGLQGSTASEEVHQSHQFEQID